MTDMHTDLSQLRSAAEKALVEAKRSSTIFATDAINWGNLRVVNVALCVSENGDEECQVEIGEASPSSHLLQSFIGERLQEAGFSYVDVRTEW